MFLCIQLMFFPCNPSVWDSYVTPEKEETSHETHKKEHEEIDGRKES